MTFRDLLGGMSKQKVLINANGFNGKYAVGEFSIIEQDFFSVQFTKESVHYPLARVLEVSTANDGTCYVPVKNNSRVEIQPETTGVENAIVLIRLSEAS